MRFTLIDRITDFQPGDQITATKSLSLAEEYLQDHFPRFPVMPGVLMLEAMYQTAAWLIGKSENFAHTVVTMKEALNVKYSDFVQPGQTLIVTAKIVKQDEATTTVKAQGMVGDTVAVGGKLVLEKYNIVDREQDRVAADQFARRALEERFALLYRPDSV